MDYYLLDHVVSNYILVFLPNKTINKKEMMNIMWVNIE